MPTHALPPPIVMKFGGAALADGPGFALAARLVAQHARERPLVVVSAAQGVTDLLESAALAAAAGAVDARAIRLRHRSLLAQLALDPELCNRLLVELGLVLESVRGKSRLDARERDVVLSFGERMSARIFAQVLRKAGVEATPVDAFDLGLTSDSNHGRARPLPGARDALARALATIPGVPVVTGFLAADEQGNLTTLGRNGSDLTAALVGEAARAREVWFWKAVEGVMTADPALVPLARTVERMSYAQAEELGRAGAKVLFPEALEPLRRARIAARVLCAAHPDAGTRVDAEPALAGPVALACRRRLVRATFDPIASELAAARRAVVAATLARRRVEILSLEVRSATLELVAPDGDELRAGLFELALPFALERDLARIVAIGAGAHEVGRVLARFAESGVVPRATIPGRERAAWLVRDAELAAAACAAHAVLFEASLARAG